MQTPEQVRAAYDAAAQEYADHYSDELEHKPRDRELLRRFAEAVGPDGVVLDLGCGPGQTTAFLRACGADVRGVDLSPELLRQARERHPEVTFQVGDMLALPIADALAAGVVAFYAIVHFSPDQLQTALRQMYRVLAPGGRLLISFHIGTEVVHVDGFLGHRDVSLDFSFFAPDAVRAELEAAGFGEVCVVERKPYADVEYQSRRAYVFARKAPADTGPSAASS
jgi:SAM-dependent methyltransferase